MDSSSERVEDGRIITLMLVVDHASFRSALEAVFGLQDDLEIVAHVGRGDVAGEVAAEHLPDVGIVDLDLSGGQGVAALAAIRRGSPETACLVLTALNADAELERAIEAGATAIVHKSAEMSELVDAVRAVARGANLLVPGEISRRLRVRRAARVARWQAKLVKGNLTPREKEVLTLLSTGRSNRAIGEELGISRETVQTHVRSLLGKLKVGSRLQAVTEAVRLGLVKLPERDSWRTRGDGHQ